MTIPRLFAGTWKVEPGTLDWRVAPQPEVTVGTGRDTGTAIEVWAGSSRGVVFRLFARAFHTGAAVGNGGVANADLVHWLGCKFEDHVHGMRLTHHQTKGHIVDACLFAKCDVAIEATTGFPPEVRGTLFSQCKDILRIQPQIAGIHLSQCYAEDCDRIGTVGTGWAANCKPVILRDCNFMLNPVEDPPKPKHKDHLKVYAGVFQWRGGVVDMNGTTDADLVIDNSQKVPLVFEGVHFELDSAGASGPRISATHPERVWLRDCDWLDTQRPDGVSYVEGGAVSLAALQSP